ncbi:hypothetical protein DKM44_01095 [Deinococcus irradiatisoli]|uniref:Uncharacterized protein n=1 Tax=Deinococcus irradiatisoli TaxID=2202254 RepID=A0A2Z3JAI0_9DEIO|nr:hypothetical protein [Deinococcus irradiatisoli]AWN22002.1 hypothetical protein DKM44_01095 [Deinococcus irradiatisoli]
MPKLALSLAALFSLSLAAPALTSVTRGAIQVQFTGLVAPPFPKDSALTGLLHRSPRPLDQLAVSSELGKRRLTLYFNKHLKPLAAGQTLVVGKGGLSPSGDVSLQYTDDNYLDHLWDSSGGRLTVRTLGKSSITVEGSGVKMSGAGVRPFTLDFTLSFDDLAVWP